MATKRIITSDMWQDEWFGQLGFFEQLLWIGLFSRCADDQGRLSDNAIIIRSLVFPYKDVAVVEIDAALKQFEADGRILRYQVEGKRLIQITRWWAHQRGQWAMPSKYPAPAGWVDQVRAYMRGKYIEENWKKVEEPEETPTSTSQLDSPGGHASEGGEVAGHNLNLDLNQKESTTGGGGAREFSNGMIFKIYEREIGALTPMIGDELADAEKTYPSEWFEPAFQEAVRANARNWRYVRAVLERWKREGFKAGRARTAESVPKGNGRVIAGGASEDVLKLIESGI